MSRPERVRAGHGVVFVVRHGAGDWSATWCDLGSVALVGPRDEVLAWASAQPAAEHLLQLPEQSLAEQAEDSEHVDLRSDISRAALQRWTT